MALLSAAVKTFTYIYIIIMFYYAIMAARTIICPLYYSASHLNMHTGWVGSAKRGQLTLTWIELYVPFQAILFTNSDTSLKSLTRRRHQDVYHQHIICIP